MTEEGALGEDAAIELESVAEYEQRIEEFRSLAEAQQDQIEALNDMIIDLSTRVADGLDISGCPECYGPLVRKNRLFRNDTIECRRW